MNKFYKSPTMMLGTLLLLALVLGTVYRIVIAINTYPGLVNANAYNVGNNYGQDLAKEEALRAEGYSVKLKVDNYINFNKEHTYKAYLLKNGVIVDNAVITADFHRQLEKEFDFSQNLIGNSTTATLPRKGKWLLVISATTKDGTLHKYHKIYAY